MKIKPKNNLTHERMAHVRQAKSEKAESKTYERQEPKQEAGEKSGKMAIKPKGY